MRSGSGLHRAETVWCQPLTSLGRSATASSILIPLGPIHLPVLACRDAPIDVAALRYSDCTALSSMIQPVRSELGVIDARLATSACYSHASSRACRRLPVSWPTGSRAAGSLIVWHCPRCFDAEAHAAESEVSVHHRRAASPATQDSAPGSAPPGPRLAPRRAQGASPWLLECERADQPEPAGRAGDERNFDFHPDTLPVRQS
jgi:hypothetical protein